MEVHGYVYYDPKLEQTEKQTLLSRLYDIREELFNARLKSNSNPYVVFKENAQGFGNFFDWHVIDDRFDVAIKQNAVAQRMNKMERYPVLLWELRLDEVPFSLSGTRRN